MPKQNCWQFKKCSREPGGAATFRCGACPASTEERLDGMNDGQNAGRVCWMVAGTFCGGKIQGTFAAKLVNCMDCQFYQQVLQEEGPAFRRAQEILAKLGERAGPPRSSPGTPRPAR